MTDDKELTSRTEKSSPGMNKDEVALELTRFIAVTTGLGKSTGSAGFAGKTLKTPEEQADALLQLFQRCRTAVEGGRP